MKCQGLRSVRVGGLAWSLVFGLSLLDSVNHFTRVYEMNSKRGINWRGGNSCCAGAIEERFIAQRRAMPRSTSGRERFEAQGKNKRKRRRLAAVDDRHIRCSQRARKERSGGCVWVRASWGAAAPSVESLRIKLRPYMSLPRARSNMHRLQRALMNDHFGGVGITGRIKAEG